MSPTEYLGDLIHAILIASPGQWVLRLLTLSAGVAAGMLSALWFPFVVWSLFASALGIVLVWVMLRPDTASSMVAIGVVVLWWLVGGGPASWWQPVVMALVLGVFHLGVAWSAAAPSAARLPVRDLGRLAVVLAAYLAVCAVAIGLVWGTASVAVIPRGLLWMALAALALIGAGAVALTALRRE